MCARGPHGARRKWRQAAAAEMLFCRDMAVLIHTRSILLREAADLFAKDPIRSRNNQLHEREWLFGKIGP
jgi:hypothetical protein